MMEKGFYIHYLISMLISIHHDTFDGIMVDQTFNGFETQLALVYLKK